MSEHGGASDAIVHFIDLGRRERLSGEETVIGRGLDVDLHVSDRRVGRRHASLRKQSDGGWRLVDLGSYNGTFVGGERITERKLENGDEVWLGGLDAIRFTFVLGAGAEAEGGLAARQVSENKTVLGPADQISATEPTRPSPELMDADTVHNPAAEPQESGRTQIFQLPMGKGGKPNLAALAGGFEDELPSDELNKTAIIGTSSVRRRHVQFMVEGFAVKNIELAPDKPITVGRDRALNVVHMDHPSVSVQHAEIIVAGLLPVVTDKGSTNGTFVNGKRIPVEEPQPLSEGDTITFGVYRSRSLIFRDSAREEIEVESGRFVDGRMRIGRDKESELPLEHVLVSRHHALIEKTDEGGYRVRDEGSQNGTFVNGRKLEPQQWYSLDDGDRIRIGPFVMNFTHGEVKAGRDSSAIRIDCRGLGRTVSTKMGPLSVMQGITLSIERRDLVGIIGPSGAGKSTFLNAISGLAGYTSGEVLYNGQNLKKHRDAIRPFIGYVPQHDKLHGGLTVRETLEFSAQMRLPKDTSDFERAARVEKVVREVDLSERIDTKVGELSGGQKKRVSIAIELLAQPGVLYLDEPTSGLDPRTTERMMYLFRRIASNGTTVVLTTHLLGNFELFDKVLVLNKGRLAYCGPGTQFFGYFDVNSPAEVYATLESDASPEEWEMRFRESDFYVGPKGGAADDEDEPVTAEASALPPVPQQPGALAQLITQTRRTLAIKVADRGGFATLLLQAPLVALLVLAIAGGLPNKPPVIFLVAVAALWFGCANSVREIVDEGEIYKRERLSVLKRLPYLGSKLLVLGGLGLVQSILFTAVLTVGGALAGSFVEATFFMTLLYFNGVAIGLIVSALAQSPTTALGAIPLVMIPQILFAGLLVPIGDLPMLVPATSQEIIESGRMEGEKLKEVREKVGDTLSSGVAAYEVDNEGKEELARFAPVAKSSRAVTLLSSVMAARWGVEGLAHLYVHDPFELQVNSSDRLYQYKLANAIYLSQYTEEQRETLRQRLRDGKGEGGKAPEGLLLRYLLILIGFGGISSGAVLLALVRRDGYEFR